MCCAGRKEMFYLTMHSTHLIGLYGVGHMVKDHSDSERGNLLSPLHVLLFMISSKGSFICTIPDRIAHTMEFDTPVVEHWLEQEITQWVDHEGSIQQPIAPWANTLTTELHLTPKMRSASLKIYLNWFVMNTGLDLIYYMLVLSKRPRYNVKHTQVRENLTENILVQRLLLNFKILNTSC